MFKVPDWGNDIPKSNVEVMNLFKKTNKRKNSNAQSKIKKSTTNKETKHKKKNQKMVNSKNKGIKIKNKMNGHKLLTKDDHISHRIMKRNLKNQIEAEKSTGTAIANGNKFLNKTDINNKMKHKISKTKGRAVKSDAKVVSGGDNGSKTLYTMNTKENKPSFKDTSDTGQKNKPIKRKQVQNNNHDDLDLQGLNTDESDEILVYAKRKRFEDDIKKEDVQAVLFGNDDTNEKKRFNKKVVTMVSEGMKTQNKKEKLKEVLKEDTNKTIIKTNTNELKDRILQRPKVDKVQKKKEKLRQILKTDSNRNVIRTNSNKLRDRMLERLKAAQFRYLNEKLYTSSGSESQELFKSDPIAFQTYHEGYQLQVKKWPVNPLDLIVQRIQKMPKTHLIADMGCGEAALSKRVSQTVRSFDLVATTPDVEACNMAHTPLLAASVDAVVFCLALMGTDLTQYLLEANRVLKIGGHLLIAEVESRFENVDTFSSEVQRLGFSLKKMDKSHQVFFFMEFSKVREAPAKKSKLPHLSLKPCLYKRR